MRIRSIEAIPIRIPRVYSAHSAFGVRSHTDAGIVRVDTEDGVTGWGEISLAWGRMGSGLCGDVNQVLSSALVGEEAARVNRLVYRMEQLLPAREDAPARAGVEMALIDAVGRATGLPAYQLLGGAVRDEIDLSFSLHMADPSEMATRATALAERGFLTLKIKMGRKWALDLQALAAVRAAVGPGVALRVDVNEGWSAVPAAARRLQEMEPYDVQLVEQPLPGHDVAGMAELRARSNIPLAADDSIWSPRDALRVIDARAADIVNVYVSEAGGLFTSRHIAELARSAGLPCWVGSMPELGLGTAANAHLAASLPRLDLASDVCGSLYHTRDILQTPLEIEGARLTVPTGPGLGVDVDPEAVAFSRLDQ